MPEKESSDKKNDRQDAITAAPHQPGEKSKSFPAVPAFSNPVSLSKPAAKLVQAKPQTSKSAVPFQYKAMKKAETDSSDQLSSFNPVLPSYHQKHSGSVLQQVTMEHASPSIKLGPLHQFRALGADHLLRYNSTPSKNESKFNVYQRVASPDVIQMIYIRNKKINGPPQWQEDKKPPEGFLKSRRYNDGQHGEDDLYEGMGDADLFYGINYEDDDVFLNFTDKLLEIGERENLNISDKADVHKIIEIYTIEVGQPQYDVKILQALTGGSSGWDRYNKFRTNNHGVDSKKDYTTKLMALNPDLPWRKGDITAEACQAAMIYAIELGGSVRFLIDGMENIAGILNGTKYQGKITSHELRFAVGIMGKTIKINEEKAITPQEGKDVFFYFNKVLIPAQFIIQVGLVVDDLAKKLAEKIAEEEEWDDDDGDIEELAGLLKQGLSLHQIEELLNKE